MIFERYIGFLDDFSTDVDVFTSNGTAIGKAQLSVKKNKVPRVEFNFITNISSFNKHKRFTCKSTLYTYHLLDCEIHSQLIVPKVLVRGDKRGSKFKKINLMFQGLSQWMNTEGDIFRANNQIIKKLDTKSFNVDLSFSGKAFSLKNEHRVDTQHVSPNSDQINEYVIITIETKANSWSSSELLSMISELRTFFTLLLGHPIGLEYVLDATDGDSINSLYYLNATKDENKDILASECFVPSTHLFIHNRWQHLLQTYFSSNNDQYRNVWSRIAGMLSYEGFWEYRILAYVSLVDRYVSIYAESDSKSLPDKQFRNYRRAARKALESIKTSYTNTEKETEDKHYAVIDSMCKQINEVIQNTTIASFGDKFDHAIDKIDNEIIKVIGFNKEDFRRLKNIRNSVAHGDEPNIKSGGDITYEVITTNKLALLLRYWAFIDMGFSYSDFISYLRNWMHPITRQANINKTALDIAAGHHYFFDVNKTNFKSAKKHSLSCLILKYIKSSNTLKVDIHATKSVSKDNQSISVEEKLMKIVDTTKTHNIAYLGNLYLKYEDEYLCAYRGACILNCPEYIFSNKQVRDRLRVFDSKTNKWLPSESEKRIQLAKDSVN